MYEERHESIIGMYGRGGKAIEKILNVVNVAKTRITVECY